MKKTVVFTLAALAGFFAANGAAENRGGGFAAFYEQRQMQLFTAIDDALSARAQETVTELADFKKAEVRLQTELGGRKGNIGVDIIGAFDESDTDAFGWQMHAYAAQQDSIGANVGVFYRWIEREEFMLGANAFIDYEDGDLGRFSRLGFGGEVRHGLAGFSANYYKPTNDERQYERGVNTFSRTGFDARLRVDAPVVKGLKIAADYYNFTGKRGTAADKGFRYGMEIAPLPALHVGWFYDDSTEKFGADIAYSHTIGEQKRQQSSNKPFAPDLFAPVSREYSQRIATVAVDYGVSLSIYVASVSIRHTPVAPVTTTVTMIVPAVPAMTTTVTNTPTPRLASVMATVRHIFTAAAETRNYLLSTQTPWVVTLPDPNSEEGARPWVVNVSGPPGAGIFDGLGGITVFAISSNANNPAQGETRRAVLINSRTYSFTIVEGSEMLVPTTTVTMTAEAIPPVTNRTFMTTEMMTMTASISITATITIQLGPDGPLTMTTGSIPVIDGASPFNDSGGNNGKESGKVITPPLAANRPIPPRPPAKFATIRPRKAKPAIPA